MKNEKYSNQTQLEIAHEVFEMLRTSGLAVRKERDKTTVEINTVEGVIFVNIHPTYDSSYKFRNVPSGMRITFSSSEYKLKLKSWIGLSYNLKNRTWNKPNKEKLVQKTKKMMFEYDAVLRRRREKEETEKSDLEKVKVLFPDFKVTHYTGSLKERRYTLSNEIVEVVVAISLDSRGKEEIEFEVEKISVLWDKRKPLDSRQIGLLMTGTTNILEGYVDGWKDTLRKAVDKEKKSKKVTIQSFVLDILADSNQTEKSYTEIAEEARKEFNSKTSAKSISWYYAKYKESHNLLPRQK